MEWRVHGLGKLMQDKYFFLGFTLSNYKSGSIDAMLIIRNRINFTFYICRS